MSVKETPKPSRHHSPLSVALLASCTSFCFLFLLHSGQADPTSAVFPFYEATALRGALMQGDTASLIYTACQTRFPHSRTTPSDAHHGVMEAAAVFVRHLEKEAATLADKLMQWACAAQASGCEVEHQSVRHLSRFHSAVARLSAIVEAIAGSPTTAVAAAVGSSSFRRSPFTDPLDAVKGRDNVQGSAATVIHSHSMEEIMLCTIKPIRHCCLGRCRFLHRHTCLLP